MRRIELKIEIDDLRAIQDACELLKLNFIEYRDDLVTIEYRYEHELFYLGSVYNSAKRIING